MPSNNLSKTKQKEIKELIEKGRQQGFLTIGEINDLLPTNLYDADQIDGIIKLITDLKIKVVESNKDIETEVVIGDEEISDDDDNEITEQEAVEVLSNLDEEFGRTSDPVRMYMREMGTVELLNRAGEIVIAKKIEEGQKLIYKAIQRFPESVSFFLKLFKNEEEIESQISDYILDVKENADEEFKTEQIPEESSSDDKEDIAIKRFTTYENNIKPVIDFYKKSNLLKVVDGEPSISEISSEISGLIKGIKG